MKPILCYPPSEILLDEIASDKDLYNRLWKDQFSPEIYEVINDSKRITMEIAIIVAKEIGGTAEFWIELQKKYDEYLLSRKH